MSKKEEWPHKAPYLTFQAGIAFHQQQPLKSAFPAHQKAQLTPLVPVLHYVQYNGKAGTSWGDLMWKPRFGASAGSNDDENLPKASKVLKKSHWKRKLHLTLGSPHRGQVPEKHIGNTMSFFKVFMCKFSSGIPTTTWTSSPTHKTPCSITSCSIRCCKTIDTSFGHHTQYLYKREISGAFYCNDNLRCWHSRISLDAPSDIKSCSETAEPTR